LCDTLTPATDDMQECDSARSAAASLLRLCAERSRLATAVRDIDQRSYNDNVTLPTRWVIARIAARAT
jgi:hypothetical protein